jgi:hypothetical protein
MQQCTEKIRERAREPVESGKVEVFVGYSKGTLPMMNDPEVEHCVPVGPREPGQVQGHHEGPC